MEKEHNEKINNMKKLQTIISNAVFTIQILLIFLLVFEQYISLPIWLEPVGRMHPMILHFPIGLLVLLGLFHLFQKEFEGNAFHKIQTFILNISAISASFTALMGFFLAQEGGFSRDLLIWHKWTGVFVSFFSYALLIINKQENISPMVFRTSLGLCIILLMIAGHYGASLTHGENYVFAPLMEKAPVISPESPFFEVAVMPILEDKCTSCHNERKHKGDLVMTNTADLLKGGENGPIWVAGDAENSSIIERIHLPIASEDHMPPEGKPQLTDGEIELLSAWIDDGADLKKTLQAFQPQEPLYQFASNTLSIQSQKVEPKYAFKAASKTTIDKLNNPFRTVVPESFNSPALHAQIFVRKNYETSSLTDLLKIKNQLVDLNLSNMPIVDNDLKLIAQFGELRKLILNGTDISGENLNELQSCQKLTSLAVSSTKVGSSITNTLGQLSSLEEVFIWDTEISTKDVQKLQIQFPHINFHLGYIPDENELLKLSPPILENEENVLAEGDKIRFKHLMKGVRIHYTLDGSEPDSINSPVYESPIEINTFTIIKAKTFMEEWIGSNLVTHTFFKKGIQPLQAELLREPNKQYQGRGSAGLIDGKKGNSGNFRTPDWLGYKDKAFAAYLDFGKQPPTINNITLSYGVNIGAYIMPPVWVEVWGGNEKNEMRRLERVNLEQPADYEANRVGGLNLEIPNSAYQFYKIIAQPVRKLPKWHRGKGDRGWVFVDEIFAY